MIFLQVYPILLYFLLILFTLTLTFLFIVIKKRRKKGLILFPSNVSEEILKMIDGISANFEIANVEEIEFPLNKYKTCIYVVDSTKNLEEHVDKLKKIGTNFENFHIVSLANNSKKLKKFFEKKKIIFIKRKELKETIHNLLTK